MTAGRDALRAALAEAVPEWAGLCDEEPLTLADAEHRDEPAEQRLQLQPPLLWPWRHRDWKPTPDDRVRQLVKAGALIAAEIDRLRALAVARADHGITS